MAKKATKKATRKVAAKVETCEVKCGGCKKSSAECGGYYFLGFIGAAVYFIAQATTFWGGVLGFLKAIVWPVFLVMSLLRYLGA